RLLGQIAATAGEAAVARERYAESLRLYREIGEQHFVALVQARLGAVALALGDAREARACYQEALPLARAVGLPPVLALTPARPAALAAAGGRPERALRQAGAAAALREAMGAPLPPPARAVHEGRLRPARAAVGDVAAGAAWAAGQAMPLEEAVADA